MRTCAGILQLAAFILGILGVIGGIVTLATPTYISNGYGGLSSTLPNNAGGILLIVSSVISWLILYAFGAALDAIADIQDNTHVTAENSARSLLANERTAEALERLVIQRRRAAQQAQSATPPNGTPSPLPAPPAQNTVLRQLGDRRDKS